MVNPTFVVASVGLALPLLAGAHIVAGDEVFRDRMAAFGPSTPVDGAKGILIAMSSVLPDDSGCSWAETPRPPSRLTFEDETQWFALVERGKCSFVDKVRAMQHMGASLVVVGDNVPHGALVTMYATGDTFDINIPSVFVSQSSYHELRKMALEPPPRGNVTHPPHLQVEVFPEELDVPILEILIVTIISPAAVMTFLYILWSWRQYRAMQAELAPVRSVQKLPRKKWLARECKENDPTICAICLEHFEDNDEVRILPCKHEFHIPCIDR
ncbi:hypothetical protein BJ742DRAFT_796230 [Cladochytrium replicatum]|nr:hypothetical protein BJ742DRAFT_796230 [Cladochytrium replicatum]